jgi:DMSO/TMAO reductase YedYZ molybdopterin-dependent catalytic subunit
VARQRNIRESIMSSSQERGIHELYEADPERADWLVFGRRSNPDRRGFLRGAGLTTMGLALGASIPFASRMPGGVIPAAFAQTPDEFVLQGKDGLIVMNDRPINLETPAHLLDPEITPVEHFFVRNNGLVPEATDDPDDWTLTIDGEVDNELTITLAELKNDFEHVTMQSVIECAGNGRAGFYPAPSGNQWQVGAVSNGEFTGVRLRDVLNRAGVRPSAVYTGHYGADPHLSMEEGRPAISRGVPIEKAMDENTLLIWGMNGANLPLAHGYPLRVLVPGWVGSASQKWLTRIWIRDQEHDGPGMTGLSYRMPRYPVAPGTEVPHEDMEVMETLLIKSIITRPASDSEAPAGEPLRVRGHAWSGETDVENVEVSMDFGVSWQSTEFTPSPNKYAWATFATDIEFPQAGYYEIWARATDSEGATQPMVVPGWNPRGYGNNSTHRIAVTAV